MSTPELSYRALREISTGRTLHAAGDLVTLPADEAAVLIGLGALLPTDELVQEPGLIGHGEVPALVMVGAREITAGELVRASFDVSGLTVEEWNALDADARLAHIKAVLDQLNLAARPPNPEASAPVTTQSAVDPVAGITPPAGEASAQSPSDGEMPSSVAIESQGDAARPTANGEPVTVVVEPEALAVANNVTALRPKRSK